MNKYNYIYLPLILSVGMAQSLGAMQEGSKTPTQAFMDSASQTITLGLEAAKTKAAALKAQAAPHIQAGKETLKSVRHTIGGYKDYAVGRAGEITEAAQVKLQELANQAAVKYANFKAFVNTPEFLALVKQGFIGTVTVGSVVYLVKSTLELINLKKFIKKHPKLVSTAFLAAYFGGLTGIGYTLYAGLDLIPYITAAKDMAINAVTNPYIAGAATFAATSMFVLKKMIAKKIAERRQNRGVRVYKVVLQ